MRLLLFQIKIEADLAYKRIANKKACNIVLFSGKNEEITFTHYFFSVYPIYHWGSIVKRILSKTLCVSRRKAGGGGVGGGWWVEQVI